jgi:hypothetical protein
MKHYLLLFSLISLSACSFFGEKNAVSDYIEKPDYSLKSVEYVPVYPDFGSGITPVSLCMGYDELLYAVDSGKAIISYDAAGRELGRFNLPGVEFVIQNRSLDLYALGRMDTLYNNVVFNVPVIYKINQKQNTEGGSFLNLNSAGIEKKLVYPFCINEPQKLNNKANLEATKLNALGFMDDNSYYVSSSGPQESAGEASITKRNSILTFSANDFFQGGFSEGEPTRYLAPFGLTTLVQPPQRARMETRKDFIYTSLTPDLAISVRYMQVQLTIDGLFTNFKALPQPAAAAADGYLYETFRFKKPVAVLYAGTSQKYLFVADAEKDSVFVFQENGYEGTNPPPQYTNRKLINVSFGGSGSGPGQFRRPSGLAWSNRVLYVADAGNRRISRYKLTSDYE